MITDQDVTKLKKTFATKQELKKLETRSDEKFARLVSDIADIKMDIAEMREQLITFADAIYTKIDGFLGRVSDMELEDKAATAHLDRHDRQIKALALNTKTILPE